MFRFSALSFERYNNKAKPKTNRRTPSVNLWEIKKSICCSFLNRKSSKFRGGRFFMTRILEGRNDLQTTLKSHFHGELVN